jgi:hypothetical protein
MKYRLFLTVFSILLFSGCSHDFNQTTNTVPTHEPTRSATIGSTIVPSPTPESHGLKVIQSSPVFQGSPSIPSGYGILLRDELNADQEDSRYAINALRIYRSELNKNEIVFKDNISGVEVDVSRDHRYIAYLKYTDRQQGIFVIDTSGEEIYHLIGSPQKVPYLVGWLDNERIILGIMTSTLTPMTTELVNIFTRKVTILDPDLLPDIYRGGYTGFFEWDSYWGVETVYSPSLDYVIYPLNANIDGMNNIVLWDRTKSAIVQEIAYSSRNYLEPIWSANGDKLLIGRGGLLSVTVNGDINTLFTLSSIPEYSDISQSRWSPNESQVGMWLWNDGKKESVLAIFDIPLNTINIYDIYRYDFTSYGIPIFSPPYWSPDGQYLLVHGAYSEGTETISGILLLDVKSNTFYKISENSHAEGWVLLK